MFAPRSSTGWIFFALAVLVVLYVVYHVDFLKGVVTGKTNAGG